jgi:hypothetical protein
MVVMNLQGASKDNNEWTGWEHGEADEKKAVDAHDEWGKW